MSDAEEILSLAFIEPLPGKDADCERVLREIQTLCRQEQYSRDELFRDTRHPHWFVLARYWRSGKARQQAHEDPGLHRYWRELATLCEVRQVFEELTPLSR